MNKKNFVKEIRAKSAKQLLKELESKKLALSKVIFDASFGKIKNHTEIKKLRKQIAQIQTVVNEKIAQAVLKSGKIDKE